MINRTRHCVSSFNWLPSQVQRNCRLFSNSLIGMFTCNRQQQCHSSGKYRNTTCTDKWKTLTVQYPTDKGLSHTPPLLLGTLFLSRSALLIMYLLSDPELKLTFSVLPTNCLNFSVVICVPQSFISCVVG